MVFFYFLFAALIFAPASFGVTARWSSIGRDGDSHFNDPSNWNTGKVPQSADTAIFDSLADGEDACILDADARIGSIVFRAGYTSSFDFNGHFLTISGIRADFRSKGEIDGAKDRGGIILAGSALQHFFPGKAHFPCVVVQGTALQTVICHETGMLTDTLMLNGGVFQCGEGLVHLCGEIRGNGGSLDFGSSSITVTGAGAFLSGSPQVSCKTGTLVFTGSGFQHVEFPLDTTTIHEMIQNCAAGCLLAGKTGSIVHIDSLAINSGVLSIADTQRVTVGILAVTRGGMKIPKSGSFTVQKSADLSGLDTGGIQGLLEFCGNGRAMTFVPGAGIHIPAISLVQGKVVLAGNGCDVDEIHLSNALRPCTLSLGSRLTHSVRSITASNGGTIDFGSSSLCFTGDTLDLSQCDVDADRSGEGILLFSAPAMQVFKPNKISVYPSLVLNGFGMTAAGTNGLTCRRLVIQSGTLHCGTGHSHTVTNLLRVSGGGLDFGSSTMSTAADTIDLTGADTLIPGTGTLSFIGAMGTQIFMPKKDAQHPDLAKSQNGAVRVAGPLRARRLWMSAGTFDPGDARCELSGFSAKGGTFVTGRDSLIITGNANFSDLSDLIAGKAPVVVRAAGNISVASFSCAARLIGNLVLSALPSPGKPARIIAAPGIHHVSRLTFQWDRSGDSAIFDFRQNNAGIVAADSVETRPTNSGSDKGAIYLGNGSWTFSGDVKLRNYVRDSSTVIFSRTTGRQILDALQPFHNVFHSGSGALALSHDLSCRNFTQSSGMFDFRGSSLRAENDVSLINGPASSIAGSPLPWKIQAGRNVFLSGSPDSQMIIGSAAPCTLSAGRSLTVRYAVLKQCAATLTKGTAYNSTDSGGNDNWTFINKPLPSGTERGPRLQCSSDTISFGTISGTRPLCRTVVLRNTGTDTLLLSQTMLPVDPDIGLDSIFRASPLHACAPQDSCIDTVRFFPKQSGSFSAFLIVKSNCLVTFDTVLVTARSTAATSDDQNPVATPKEFTFQEIATLEKSVVFKYCLPATSKVILEFYDAIGRFLERPVESVLGPAEYQFTWDASRLSRGIYFCRLKVTDQVSAENRFFKTIRVVFSK